MTAEFDAALDALDFDAARSVLSSLTGDQREGLQDRLDEAVVQAENDAESLAGRIQSLARADHYEGLLAIADDAKTEPLLGLLSPEIRRGADLHLEGARRRQQRFQASASTQMDEADEALLLLDTTSARAALDRIDRRWLGPEQRERLDELTARTEAVAAERREIEARTAAVLKEHQPAPTASGPASVVGRVVLDRRSGSWWQSAS